MGMYELFTICFAGAMRAVTAVAARAVAPAFVLQFSDDYSGNCGYESYAHYNQRGYFKCVHAFASADFLFLRLNLILPLLYRIISVVASAAAASQMNRVHHLKPIVYTAALIT